MGLNVMGKTVMRNLFSKPATEMYPVVKKEFFPATRGSILFDESVCNYCTLCAKRCPSQAIAVDRAEKMWRIDRKRCINCNFCISVCNKGSLSCAQEYSVPVVKEFDPWMFQAERLAGEKSEGLERQRHSEGQETARKENPEGQVSADQDA